MPKPPRDQSSRSDPPRTRRTASAKRVGDRDERRSRAAEDRPDEKRKATKRKKTGWAKARPRKKAPWRAKSRAHAAEPPATKRTEERETGPKNNNPKRRRGQDEDREQHAQSSPDRNLRSQRGSQSRVIPDHRSTHIGRDRKPTGKRSPGTNDGAPATAMRIAKAMARAGLCSRRDAERWIADGRVAVNGETIASAALTVGPKDHVIIDGKPLPAAAPTRLWRYAKPRGLVTTNRDPEGRPTVFEALPEDLPRVMSVGRLDYNTEGLLLLTTDGELARYLELPATGWLRRYRVRAHCAERAQVTQTELDSLRDGVTIDGVHYGPIEATLDSAQGANVWLTLGLREGKNREVRKILGSLGLEVNRLIRVSFGPFQLLDMKPGRVELVQRKVLVEQLGAKLARRFNLAADDEEKVAMQPRSRRASPRIRAGKQARLNDVEVDEPARKPFAEDKRSSGASRSSRSRGVDHRRPAPRSETTEIADVDETQLDDIKPWDTPGDTPGDMPGDMPRNGGSDGKRSKRRKLRKDRT